MYILLGNPVPLQRARMGNSRVYDPQKHQKILDSIEVAQQHNCRPLLEGALLFEIHCYFDVNKTTPKRRERLLRLRYHTDKPDLDNVIKYYSDICNTVVYKDDCQIAVIKSFKYWDEKPRVEFNFTEILP